MTSPIRMIWNNVSDDCSAITATSTSGSLAPANLIVEEKAAVWRSTSLAAQTLDMRWASAQTVDSICGAWSNFTSGATIRCKGYTNVGDPVAVFDQTVSPDTALSIGNTTFQNWIASSHSIKQLLTIVTDASNPDGYVELSRLVVGKRISPVVNPDQQSFSIGFVERGSPEYAESGDLRMEIKGRHRRLEFQLSRLEPASRDLIVAMVAQGLGQGVWVSVFPDDSTASTVQLHAFWGALVNNMKMGYPLYNVWSAPLAFEEMGDLS